MRQGALAALLVLAGCYSPDVKLGVPCSDTGDCPRGQECDAITNVCMAPTELLTWREDSAADFTAAGATLVNAHVEEPGVIAPIPYATGRVRIAGIASDTIGDVSTATWASASAGPITGYSLAPALAIDFSDDPPFGIGLTTGDGITVLIEGEIHLDVAGVWRFELDANDKGFFEIAAPGEDFTHLTYTTNADSLPVDYTVTTPGWYRLRGAFADNSAFMNYQMRADSPGQPGGLRPVASDSLRARVDDLQGYLVDGFNEGGLLDYIGSTVDTEPLDRQIGGNLFGMPTGVLGWSYRWTGQILIEAEGEYAFHIESLHGHRMWIDGMEVANEFSASSTATSTTAPIHLAPGWHDLVADVSKEDTPTMGRLNITVESGPAWVGEPVPIDHVRPVIGRSARWVQASNATTVPIPDGSVTTRTVSIQPPLGFMPFAIEAGFEIVHDAREQVFVILDPPTGPNITLFATDTVFNGGTHNDHTTLSLANYGTSWSFIVGDNALDAIEGSVTLVALTVLGRGGVEPFPTSFRYESAIRDLGNVVGLGAVSWQLRQGESAAVAMRTCDAPEECASQPWTDVVAGEVPMLVPRRYAQYALDMTTDGDVPAAFDWFELTYSARPE